MSKRYLIQYSLLKNFVNHGMVVEKFHEVFPFEQSRWLKSSIYFKTNKRAAPTKDFAKVLLK